MLNLFINLCIYISLFIIIMGGIFSIGYLVYLIKSLLHSENSDAKKEEIR